MVKKQRVRLEVYFRDSLKRGVKSGEFYNIPVAQIGRLMIALLDGILQKRQRCLEKDNRLLSETTAFSRRSRVKDSPA